tara:strand:- start:412 stop:900 length:489 start_codon:yes stop_codon:yes gene_type:complete
MLIESIKEKFTEISALIQSLNSTTYTKPIAELGNASIGEHTRHIIEMHQTLLHFYDLGIINYELRERNLAIQTDIEYAVTCMQNLVNNLEKPNKNLILKQGINNNILQIESNYERELLYNLEHCIHHQALIKVAVLKLPHIQVSENFGVSHSTIKYKKQCAQ